MKSLECAIGAMLLLFAGGADAQFLAYSAGQLGTGWSVTGDGATVTPGPWYYEAISNSASGKMVFTHTNGVSTSNCNVLWFSVTNPSPYSAQDVIVRLYDGNNAEIGSGARLTDYFGATIRQETTLEIRIPLYRWSGSPMTVKKIVVEVAAASTIRVGLIGFDIIDSLPDPYPSFVYNYSLFGGWSDYSTGVAVDYDSHPFGGYQIRIQFTSSGGLLDVRRTTGTFDTSAYDSLAFTVTVGHPTVDLYVALRDQYGNVFTDNDVHMWEPVRMHCDTVEGAPGYIPSNCMVQIPLAMLGAEGQPIKGLVFKTATSSSYNVDNLELEVHEWPLHRRVHAVPA